MDTSQTERILSPFLRSPIGSPPQGKQAAVSLGVNNNLQIKVRNNKDTAKGYKNVTLIDGLGIATSYNAAADSFRWSDIGVNFRTNVLDKVNITGSAGYSP
jgi:ethanolamine utilization protein EutA (predicted chaperonin)